MSIVRTSPKGQVVVPADLRRVVGLEPGDLVRVSHAGGRKILIEPVGDDPVAATRGMLAADDSLTRALQREREEDDARQEAGPARLLGDARPSE